MNFQNEPNLADAGPLELKQAHRLAGGFLNAVDLHPFARGVKHCPNYIGALRRHFRQGRQRLQIRGAGDAALGDDGGDVLVGGDVESRVLDGDAFGSEADAGYFGDLGGGALLDGDLVAGGQREVEGGDGRGDVGITGVLARENPSDGDDSDFTAGSSDKSS